MRGWMGTGIGMGMRIRVPGTVENGYKYLSPCSSLVFSPALNNWYRVGLLVRANNIVVDGNLYAC